MIAVHFLKLLAEPELRYRYATRVAEWEVIAGLMVVLVLVLGRYA